MSDNIFEEVDLTQDPDESLLEALKAKFPDPDSLLRAKAESDKHIAQIERENRELREKITKSATAESILTEIRNQAKVKELNEVDGPAGHQASTEDNPAPDNSSIEQVVAELLAKREQESKLSKNREEVSKRLLSHFNDDVTQVQKVLTQKARELNTTVKQLEQLGNENPNMLFTLMQIDSPRPSSSVAAPQSSFSMAPKGDSTKNQTYYENMKRTNFEQWKSKAIQAEMYREAMKQGEAFFT